MEAEISTICIDFQGALTSYTGIPLCTKNDTIIFSNAGYSLILWVSDDESRKAAKNWIASEKRLSNPNLINIVSTRPSNLQMWFIQFFGIAPTVPEAEFFYCSLFPGIKLSKTCKRIIRLHDPFGGHRSIFRTFFENPARLKLRIAKALRTKAFLGNFKKSLLIFNSEYTYSRYKEIYGLEIEGHVIHNLVQFDGLESIQLTATKRYFLIISGSRQRKKPDVIINIWAQSSLSTSVDLMVVGSVPTNLLSQEAIALLDLGRLRILKQVESLELKSLIKNCVATIFYSLGEGWGQPLAESVFCGKLVICNDLEVFHEVVGGVGMFFPTDSPKEFLPLAFQILSYQDKGMLNETQVSNFGRRYGIEILKNKWLNSLENGKF